jgi:hypothetical protein
MTQIAAGTRVRRLGLPGVWTVDNVVDGPDALIVYVQDDRGGLDRFEIPHGAEPDVEVLTEDGSANPQLLLTGFWVRWMQAASATARATALATTPLKPCLHQDEAVYGKMLPQPQLRFLLADEPGTGKTIMAGLYLREMQRLGFVHPRTHRCSCAPGHEVAARFRAVLRRRVAAHHLGDGQGRPPATRPGHVDRVVGPRCGEPDGPRGDSTRPSRLGSRDHRRGPRAISPARCAGRASSSFARMRAMPADV